MFLQCFKRNRIELSENFEGCIPEEKKAKPSEVGLGLNF